MDADSTTSRPPTPAAATTDVHQVLLDVLRDESKALTALAEGIASGATSAAWSAAVKQIDECAGHVVVSGMGKSGLIGAKISATFSSLGIPSHVVHPADAVHGDLGAIRSGDLVILLSYSGTTAEILDLATILQTDGVTRLGISRSDDSELARLCDIHLPLGDLDEAGPLSLAPSTSTTATLACGDALAMAVAHSRAFTASEFRRRHPGGSLGSLLRPVSELIRFRPGENLTTTTVNVPLRDALRRVAEDHDGGVRHAGAVLILDADDKIAGLFTDGDLRRLILENPDALDQPIGDVMTRSPRTIHESATVQEARRMLTEFRVDELPVVNDANEAVGLIDIQDLLAPRVVMD